MTNTLKKSSILVSIAVCLSLLGAVTVYILKKKAPSLSTSRELLSTLEDLRRYWSEGDRQEWWKKNLLRCEKLPAFRGNVSSEFLRCNPFFLECLWRDFKKGTKLSLPFNQNIELSSDERGNYFSFKLRSKENKVGVKFHSWFEINGFHHDRPEEKVTLLLPNDCHEVELPKDRYAHGPFVKGRPDEFWDNNHFRLFIDKRQVTNLDVDNWKKYLKKTLAYNREMTTNQSYMPATNLTLYEMKSFCHDHGKTLLQTHVYEAASFSWEREGVLPEGLSLPRSPYPWHKKSSQSFLEFAKKDAEFPHQEAYCDLIYTKECLGKVLPHFFSSHNVTWVGMSDSLGGYPEALDNKMITSKNLRLSSFYFDHHSYWHQVGVYGHWTGESFRRDSVRLREDEAFPEEDIEVAFRCMRLEVEEK